jgi:hypothetical protein
MDFLGLKRIAFHFRLDLIYRIELIHRFEKINPVLYIAPDFKAVGRKTETLFCLDQLQTSSK